MKRILLTIYTTLGCAIAFTQEVIEAEQAFAAYARNNSIKAAFLQYMDSSAVVFNNGRVSNGPQYWNAVPESGGKLLWHPVFSGTAASGELGFTTGPFEYRVSLQDSATAFGQYTTIWRKNGRGEWRFLVDLGVSYKNAFTGQWPTINLPVLMPDNHATVTALSIEMDFLKEYTTIGSAAYPSFLLPNSWFNFDGMLPATDQAGIQDKLSKIPAPVSFEPLSGGISYSRDFAYIYGIATHDSKKENYLRVWIHGKEGWKILLQVLKW